MNVAQLHERLRIELVRRIDRKTLTAAMLARQTGLQQSHISNVLHRKRRLGVEAIDRVLAVLGLSVEDLLPSAPPALASASALALESIPLVSQASAMFDPRPLPSATSERISLPFGTLSDLRPRQSARRRDWLRFVAVGVTPLQARPMEPALFPNEIVILDRHYTSLVPHLPPRPNIYAVRIDNAMLFRYVSFEANRLVLRPFSLDFPVQLVEVEPQVSPNDLIIGRVCNRVGSL